MSRDAVFVRHVPGSGSRGWGRPSLFLLLLLFGCGDSGEPAVQYLLRVGSHRVSVSDFEQALEIGKTAYPWQPEKRSELLWIVRRRMLLEMIEELLIFERADELGIAVSDRELDDYVASIRADYPEGAFEEIFIEEAISYSTWRKRTRERMLLAKVIEADLRGTAQSTPPADAGPGGAGSGDASAGAPRADLPIPGSDDRYEKWISALAARIPVEINTELWKKLYGS